MLMILKNEVVKEKILVVDDDDINIGLLTNLLDSEYEVFSANNGVEAIQLAIQEKPSLILLDIIMPGMDGNEVCSRLKKEPHTADIPIIFLTAKESEKDEAYALEQGAVDYIVKPFRPVPTMQRVKTHIALGKKTMRNIIARSNGQEDYFDFEKELIKLYALTKSESRLANALLNGLTLEEIANNSGLKYNTLKGYLKVIFQKTDTNKQHELVAKIYKEMELSPQ